MSNFNLGYNKMDFISVLEILQKLWLSKNVVKIDWFPHGKIFHWKSFKPANRNVCFEIVRRPLNEARYENWPIWNWKKSYRLLVKFIWVFTCSEMIWNSYRGRFHIGYFDRFEIQHPIWVALRIFVVQVCAWKHEKW